MASFRIRSRPRLHGALSAGPRRCSGKERVVRHAGHMHGVSVRGRNSSAARPRRPSRPGREGGVCVREVRGEAEVMRYAKVGLVTRSLKACLMAAAKTGGARRRDFRKMASRLRRRLVRVVAACQLLIGRRDPPPAQGRWSPPDLWRVLRSRVGRHRHIFMKTVSGHGIIPGGAPPAYACRFTKDASATAQ